MAQWVKSPPEMQETQRNAGLILGLGRSPGGGNGNPLQYSCLKRPMDRGAWQARVQRVAKSWTTTEPLSTQEEPAAQRNDSIDFLLWKKIDNKNFRKALQC